MTNSTRRSRAVRVAGPGPAVQEFIDQHREARAYAEQWYPALRRWQVRIPVVLRPTLPYRSGALNAVTTLGDDEPDSPTALLTPMAKVRKVEAGRIITQLVNSGTTDGLLLGKRLEASRSGKGMSSLIHANGRGWNGETAPEYARAVLSVAVRLGDPFAEFHHKNLPSVRD